MNPPKDGIALIPLNPEHLKPLKPPKASILYRTLQKPKLKPLTFMNPF